LYPRAELSAQFARRLAKASNTHNAGLHQGLREGGRDRFGETLSKHLRRLSSRPSFAGVAEQEFHIVQINSDMIARFAQRDIGQVGLALL
jgi:hypothetical protein